MRVGAILDVGSDVSFAALCGLAERAEAVGLDLCWIRPPSDQAESAWSPTTVAAALGAVTNDVRLAIQVPLGGHPIEIAEEVIVADLSTNGRVVAVLDAAPCAADVLDESLELVLAGLAPRPFRHKGPTWTIPRSESAPVRVTPGSAQFDLPVHLIGCRSPEVSDRFGVPPVVDQAMGPREAADLWRELDSRSGAARHRWGRIAVRAWDRSADAPGLAAELRQEQVAWGLDTSIVDLSGRSAAEIGDAIDTLGRLVRPQLQLPSVPSALTDLWTQTTRA